MILTKCGPVLEMFYRKEKGSVNLPLVEMHFYSLFLPLLSSGASRLRIKASNDQQ